MTVSDCKNTASELLDRALDALNPARIAQVIDKPMNDAASDFSFPVAELSGNLPSSVFLEGAGAFVRHLWMSGIPGHRVIGRAQGEAEAVALLESSYTGLAGSGYDAALIDAVMLGLEGLDYILGYLLDASMQAARRQYLRWVLEALLSPSDWELRKALTTQFVRRAGSALPAEITDAPPGRFANMLPQLVLNYIDAQSECMNMLNPSARK